MPTRINGIDCDDFTVSYLGTALWSSTVMLPVPEGELVNGCMDVDDQHPLHGIAEWDHCDEHFCCEDFTEDALRAAVADCAQFQEENGSDLCDEDDGHAGHNFWLNRNGHGAGFWDGDYEEEKGNRLSAACEDYTELYICVGEVGSLTFE
jgi:hypothetical protein